MKIPKDIYRSLFRLYGTQEWLASRESYLLETLDLCETLEEQRLVQELLSRFVYLNSGKLSVFLNGLADLICRRWTLDKAKTQLVAVTADYEPDSAQYILQALKPLLPVRGWNDVKQNNLFTRSFKDLHTHPIVVLIDEFSGTGNTISSRIRSLKAEATQREKSLGIQIDLQIYVALIASMAEVKDIVRPQCAEFEAQIFLQKGISDNFEGDELEAANRDMIRLESVLKQDLPDVHFPSFGYGRAEALYSLENGNTPNSVFPIFWWRYLSDGKQRTPLLDRQDPKIP